MLSAAVTIPSAFRERETLFKHRSAEFYDGRVAYVAQLLTDAPLSILEAILLSCISYFWVGLSSIAGDFFYFMGSLVALECAGQALGRLLCALCRKQVTANAMSSVVILIFGTVGGFMPSYGEIHPILQWLSWLTPVSFAFEGLMINEFYGSQFDPVVAVNQDGPTPLAVGGDAWLDNYDLPRIEFANPHTIRVFNIFMVFIFAVIYDLLGFYYIEKTRGWYHNQTRRPQSRVKRSFAMGASDEAERGVTKPSPKAPSAQEANSTGIWPQCLAVRDLCYEVPIKKTKPKFSLWSLLRQANVRLAGKQYGKHTVDETLQKGNNLMLLHSVNARFSRGRMTGRCYRNLD